MTIELNPKIIIILSRKQIPKNIGKNITTILKGKTKSVVIWIISIINIKHKQQIKDKIQNIK